MQFNIPLSVIPLGVKRIGFMDVFEKIGLNCFSFVLCMVMYVANLNISDKNMLQNRLFRWLIQIVMALLMLEILTWLVNEKPGEIFFIFNNITNTLFFISGPVPAMTWALYASYQLFHDIHRLRIEMIASIIPIAFIAILTILSPLRGLIFRIDSNNIYQRGPFFIVFAIVSFLPIVYSVIVYIIFRKRIPKKIFIPMLLFIIPPIIGAIMQSLFYGITLLWSSVTISMFIIHNNVQTQKLNLDHLTGLYNRRQIDSYLNDKIQSAKKGKGFSCIILDIDNFKSINDNYGHIAGDEALVVVSQILKLCIRNDDFLARYGGDEFIIVLDIDDQMALKQTINRIRAEIAEYNHKSSKPFGLSLSAGYKVYDSKSEMTRKGFISKIDSLMYQDKEIKNISKIP